MAAWATGEGGSNTVTTPNRIGYHVTGILGCACILFSGWLSYTGRSNAVLFAINGLIFFYFSGRFQDSDRWGALFDYLRAVERESR